GGGDAVDIIVAIDDDFVAVADGAGDAFGGTGEVGNPGRVVQRLEAGVEKLPADVELSQAAVEPHLRHHRRGAQLLRQPRRRRMRLGNGPAFRLMHPCGSSQKSSDLRSAPSVNLTPPHSTTPTTPRLALIRGLLVDLSVNGGAGSPRRRPGRRSARPAGRGRSRWS